MKATSKAADAVHSDVYVGVGGRAGSRSPSPPELPAIADTPALPSSADTPTIYILAALADTPGLQASLSHLLCKLLVFWARQNSQYLLWTHLNSRTYINANTQFGHT